MNKQLILLTPFMSVLLAACSDPAAPKVGGDPCAQVRNSIDRTLCAEFTSIGFQPLVASDQELCTRLSVDLLGRRPTPEELDACAQLDVVELVESHQGTEAYRRAQRRRWADRFSYSDSLVDPFAIEELDGLVDRMYRGEMKYSELAIEALAHPAFVGRHLGYGLPEDVARAAFRIFLGRVATKPEAADLGPLWSAWVAGAFYRAIDQNGFTYGSLPYVDVLACEKDVRSCQSTLLGNATVELERAGRPEGTLLSPAELSPADWEQLRAPGRLFVSLDIFWEAQVDEVLEHFLGYDLGTLRPGVRDALVRELRTHESIVELERSVVTSVAYLQSAKLDAEHAAPEAIRDLPLAHGPSKLMTPEAWLHSVGAAIGTDVGDCDFRYPALPSELYDPYTGGPIDLGALDDFWPRKVDGTIDRTFRDMAAAMGGCPGSFDPFSFTISTRSDYMGLIAAVGQEEAALGLCLDSAASRLIPSGVGESDTSATAIEQTVEHVLTRLFGSVPAEEITEATDRALAGCSGCSAEQVARQLCSGVSAGVEYIFH